MRILLILLLATSLLTACDNNPFANNNRKKDTRDKTDKDDRDRNDDYDDEDKDDTRSNWTKKQRNHWMDKCLDELRDESKAKQICSCAVDKLEQKYPDERDIRDKDVPEGDRLIEDCEARVKGDKYDEDDDDDFTTRDKGKNSSFEEDYYGWTSTQRELYIDQCATVAKQNIGASLARSYCDCMQNKIEKKYRMSFSEANKITQEELSTPEAKADIQECLGN
jgi:hypothetical protein